jgi:hypothetical protein
MANKEKNTKEEPHLLNDDYSGTIDYDYVLNQMKQKYNWGDLNPIYLEDFEDSEYYTDTDDNENYLEQFNDYMYKIQVGEIEEVETKTVKNYDLEKADDIEEFNDDLMRVSDLEKVKVGKDMAQIEESKIITAESFKRIVNDFDKINLSESEIMSILKKTQNPIMKKSELMETIEKKLIFEANMDDSVRRSFESGENDYNEILGRDLTNQLAQESFQEIAQKIREKTGRENVTLDDVQQLMSSSLLAAAKEEYRLGIDRLEQKAVDMIRKQFNIPVDAVEFEATITGLPPQQLVGRRNISPQEAEALSRQIGAKVGTVEKGNIKSTSGNVEVPQGKTSDEMKGKVKRRRLTNAMMHGAARKSQNLHHLDDQLRQENPRLGQNYANLMAANDASYFMMNDETIRREGEEGVHAGNSRIDLSNSEKPKVIAQGIVFPILLHELAKGVLELMSLWGLPEDVEEKRYVLDKTDNLASETNDIRLGTKLWERFVRQIPIDNQEVISLTWSKLQELDDREYNSIIEGLIENRTEAEMEVKRLAEEALAELQEEASDDEFGGYEDSPEQDDDGDVLTPPEDEGPGEPQPEEPSGSDYENMY